MNHLKKHKPQFLMLLFLLVAIFGSGCVGWASSALPPRLSAAERARLKGAHLPLTVGVESYKFPAYSESLRKALQRTRLFDRVDELERFSSPPSLVARVERRVHGSAVLPFHTLLTFGLIPTFTQETHGESFSLSPVDRPDQRVLIEYTYRGRTTLGWIALLEGLHPDITIFPFDPERSRRFRGRLALSILNDSDSLTK